VAIQNQNFASREIGAHKSVEALIGKTVILFCLTQNKQPMLAPQINDMQFRTLSPAKTSPTRRICMNHSFGGSFLLSLNK